MKLYPSSTIKQLEFDKIKSLVAGKCRSEYAKQKAENLRIHTRIDFIRNDLQQTAEYKELVQAAVYFPNDFTQNISREIKLLGIQGATLSSEQFMHLRQLLTSIANIFRWFTVEMRDQYAALTRVIENNYYEKSIIKSIDEVLDESGIVKDNASKELAEIRMRLYRKRNEQRRIFDRLVGKLNKLGYLSDISESFMNGRRVLAVFAEQKRQVKGIMHSESDSRRTSFIEPEETAEINNEVFSLETEETREVNRILRALTASLAVYAPLLQSYYEIAGEYDFIKAKASFASEVNGNFPVITEKAQLHLIEAYHPLLYLYNKEQQKPTIPVDLHLTPEQSILVISGPNAGGKTVTLKTVGLLQIMLQSGLLVPVSPDSTMGIFKQIMIHIGDEQSLEFELSTYSSHLKNMKHFIENANGKTLFFIDELGSGSDPNLGGAFAEVIMEELAFKHAFGIVTTHYLNLKVMAGKVKGIVNGAMQFDEKNLLPLYKLQTGKPGSSYTFSIAERIGLDKKLISKARKLVDESQYKLDSLLNRTEQDLQIMEKEKKQLDKLLIENKELKEKMQKVLQKENHKEEVEKLQLQNKISEDKLTYLKDMERRLKAMIVDWKKSDDKEAAMKNVQSLLFAQKNNLTPSKKERKMNEKFAESGEEIRVGDKARMKANRQVGTVVKIEGKKAVIQLGLMPISVSLENLVKVIEKEEKATN